MRSYKLNHLSDTENGALALFISKVRSRFSGKIVSLRLFGSRARGEGNEDSDIDILVLLKKSDLKTKNSIWDIANDIFLDTWINISPLVMSELDFRNLSDHERQIAKDIKNEGVLL